MMLYGLADRLHKTLDEIRAMPIDEVVGWVAYFQITAPKAK